MVYTVYILRFDNNAIYIGQTNNLQNRLLDHQRKKSSASKFSKENGDFVIVYQERYESRVDAMRREKQLKGWTRAKKEALIAGDLELLRRL